MLIIFGTAYKNNKYKLNTNYFNEIIDLFISIYINNMTIKNNRKYVIRKLKNNDPKKPYYVNNKGKNINNSQIPHNSNLRFLYFCTLM